MTNSSQRITSTINLGALVLISSFLQHNKVIQYVLLAVAVVIAIVKGLASKRFSLKSLVTQDDCDYVSLGIWLLITSLLFYLGHQTGGFIALGILILLSLANLLCKILPSGKTE